jgi:hypothetical protein
MSPADKIKLTNMIDQGVNHTLATLEITDREEIMNHFEKVAVSILDTAYPEYFDELKSFIDSYLQKKADKLGVTRSYKNEQEK